MIEWIKVLALAVVQGVAEFLPISSSGHLAVLGKLFGFDPEAGLALGIVLHAGTLCSILVFYFMDLLQFLKPRRFHLLLMVILGSVPAGVAGLLFKSKVEQIFGDMALVGVGFLVTAALLWWTAPRRPEAEIAANPELAGTPLEQISWRQALLIGVAQALAIWPGLSRSGSTISAGLCGRLEREAAMRFSFLLAIPAIGGAAVLELADLVRESAAGGGGLETPYGLLVVGFLTSAVVGYFALAWLLKLLQKGRLSIFSWYLCVLGVLVIGWRLWEVVR